MGALSHRIIELGLDIGLAVFRLIRSCSPHRVSLANLLLNCLVILEGAPPCMQQCYLAEHPAIAGPEIQTGEKKFGGLERIGCFCLVTLAAKLPFFALDNFVPILAIVRDLLALGETAAFRLGAFEFLQAFFQTRFPLLPKIGIVERSVWRLLWLLLVESAGDTCNCEPDQCSADNSTGNPSRCQRRCRRAAPARRVQLQFEFRCC